jgi:ferrous iron transport protein A
MLELLTLPKRTSHTGVMMQLSVKKDGGKRSRTATNLSELRPGEQGILDRLELPEETAKRLMELGFVPGHVIEPALSAPGGEPRVYRVDGSEIAIRRETAKHLIIRKKPVRS